MKIIITSGGTSEKIDDVRRITNASTGRLGGLIAHAFYKSSKDIQIYYVCSSHAYIPDIPNISRLNVITISDTASLLQELEHLLTTQKIDAVIHAMAVSDYYVKSVNTAESIADAIISQIAKLDANTDLYDTVLEAIVNTSALDRHEKISSNHNNLMLSFAKNQKVIARIKKWQPSTTLVGFKLLNKVTETQLIDVGHNLLLKNNCDFVLANDLQYVQKDAHIGFLINSHKSYTKFDTKECIAEGIVSNVMNVIQKIGEGV